MDETGTVKFYDLKKGFGFIVMPDGTEAFIKSNDLIGGTTKLVGGQAVEFDLVNGRKGPQARNCRPVGTVLPPVDAMPAKPRWHDRHEQPVFASVADFAPDDFPLKGRRTRRATR